MSPARAFGGAGIIFGSVPACASRFSMHGGISRHRAWISSLVLVSAMIAAPDAAGAGDAAPNSAGEVTDEAVEAQIRRLQNQLLGEQRNDGGWIYGNDTRDVGLTGLAALSLLTSGVAVDHPAVTKAAEYISKRKTSHTYTE